MCGARACARGRAGCVHVRTNTLGSFLVALTSPVSLYDDQITDEPPQNWTQSHTHQETLVFVGFGCEIGLVSCKRKKKEQKKLT